jgi:molecular chaperone DnaJ
LVETEATSEMELYARLGLTRSASSAEIERAYRRLARRYHPGVNPGDRVAEQAYEQIQHAYEVLTDAKRRRDYDRGATSVGTVEATVAFEGFDFSTPAEGPLAATFSELFADVFQQAAREAAGSGGRDIDLPIQVSFLEAMQGIDAPVSLTRLAPCGTCDGLGRVARATVSCPLCEGTGQRRWARGHMVFTRTCDGCGGQGQLARETCRSCRGAGVAMRTEVVTVHVPAGIEPDARIAIPGRGHAGGPGAQAGDLYVRVHIDPHPYFRRSGRDVHMTLPVGVHEAALGAVIEVPSLGPPVQVRIPPGTAAGQWLRLRGGGVTAGDGRQGAGDLVIEVQIVMPATLDARSRELLKEFGRRHDMTSARRVFFERN